LKRVESFRLLAPYLDDPALRAEAAAAIVQIAPALVESEDSIALKMALETIAESGPNETLRTRAAQTARRIPERRRRAP
jgi:hypothetical protein